MHIDDDSRASDRSTFTRRSADCEKDQTRQERKQEEILHERVKSVQNGTGTVLSGTLNSAKNNSEITQEDFRSLDVIRHAIFSEGARKVLLALLTSQQPLTMKEVVEWDDSISVAQFQAVRVHLVGTTNPILFSERADKGNNIVKYSVMPAWRQFFTKTAYDEWHPDRFSLKMFARLRQFYDELENEYIRAWLPHLLQGSQTYSQLRGIFEVPLHARNPGEAHKWLSAKCSKLVDMIAVDSSPEHAEDPLVSLYPDFKDWFIKMMQEFSKTIRQTSLKESITEEIDLSHIAGSEFFDDLDDGFDDELRSLGVDPASPTAAKPGSEEKVIMLAARYAAGLPLWHPDDCYDHGAGSVGNLVIDDELQDPTDADLSDEASGFDAEVGDPEEEKNRRIALDDWLASEKVRKKKKLLTSHSFPPIPQDHE